MLVYLRNFPEYTRQAARLGKDVKIKGKVTELVVAGSGASGIVGDILRDYLDIPVRLVKGYSLPGDLGKGTLVILVSYSGNTEEVLSVLKEVKKKGLRKVIITSGGELGKETPRINVPEGLPPRAALPWMLIPALNVLKGAKLVKGLDRELQETLKLLKKFHYEPAKDLAEKVHRKTPVIYSSGKYAGVVKRWKDQVNENAKALALAGLLPEVDHNELMGHSNPILRDHFHTIILRDRDEDPRILRRMELTARVIKELGEKVTILNMPKGSYLARMLATVYFGDWFSYYLGMEYRVDTVETKIQEEFKKEMKLLLDRAEPAEAKKKAPGPGSEIKKTKRKPVKAKETRKAVKKAQKPKKAAKRAGKK